MIGKTLHHYKVEKKLGSGGMGEVYLALDTDLGRQVALKFLPSGLGGDPDVRARFKREAQALAALNHPHVVTVYGVAEHEGRPFIVMEYVSGITLREWGTQADHPLAQIVDRAIQLADALAMAHKVDIVHRDIKSDNILLSSDEHVKLLDFGLATRQGLSRLTREGSTVGTAAYMSPEQACGKAVDSRTDLFSLGVVLYELTTQRLPFQGDHEAAVAYAVMHEEPAPMARYAAKVPDEWQRIVSKCLRKDASERYSSASDLEADLKAFRRTLAGSAPTDAPADARPSIAVLPFTNMSSDPENEYFSDGLTEELLNVLARNPELKVTGRTSSFMFKGRQQDLREIGQKLGVQTLLEGSVRKSGNRVRITAQLVKASDGFHLWSSTYDRVVEDVFAVQDEIAGAVGQALNITLLGSTRTRVVKNPEVYSLMLQGTHLCYQNSETSVAEAERFFSRALEIEPDSADALAGLAQAYMLQGGFGHGITRHKFEQARNVALRAASLDPHCVSVHLSLSYLYLTYDQNWAGCHRACEVAAELAPGDVNVLFRKAMYIAAVDHPSRALPLMHKARELDPLNARCWFFTARFHHWCGNLEEAAADFRRTLALSPDFTSAHARLGFVLLEQEQPDQALEEVMREPESGYRYWGLALVHHALGQTNEFDAALRRLEQNIQWAVQIAGVHAFCGKIDSAFEWLEVARREHDAGICWTKNHPNFKNLHGDARWAAFMNKLGLTA